MQELTVINDMLGTLGEAPLNSLTEEHPLLGACQRYLEVSDIAVQAQGHWYNKETLTLQPSAVDSALYVPGDTIGIRSGDRTVTLRGRRLYDLENGTYAFEDELEVTLIRRVPFTELPELAAGWVAADAVLRFQRVYDGDNQRTQQLQEALAMARAEARAEDIRNSKSNFLDSNYNLTYLRSRIWRGRSWYY